MSLSFLKSLPNSCDVASVFELICISAVLVFEDGADELAVWIGLASEVVDEFVVVFFKTVTQEEGGLGGWSSG